jgi:hypothetical protein
MVFFNYSEKEYLLDIVEDSDYFTGKNREIWLYKLGFKETKPPIILLSLINPITVDDTVVTFSANQDITLYRRMVIYNDAYNLFLIITNSVFLNANTPTPVKVFPAEGAIPNVDQVIFPVYPMKPLFSLESGNITKTTEQEASTNNKGQGLFNAKGKITADADINIQGTVNRHDPCLSLLDEIIEQVSRVYVELRLPAFDNYGEGFAAQSCQAFLNNYSAESNRDNMESLTFTLRVISDSEPYQVLGKTGNILSQVFPLDIALLNNSDSDNGMYFATSQNITYLHESLNNSNFNLRGYLPQKSLIGKVLSPLPVTNFHYLDKRKIIVHLESGDNFPLGFQFAIIGEEVIGFDLATNNGLKTWELTGIYRGLLGTERFVNTHQPSETFILLNNVYRFFINPSNIGNTLYYKNPIGSQSLANLTSVAKTYEAISQYSFAPHFVGLEKYPNGDLLIQWVRRPRKNNGLQDNQDVPLDQSSENYRLTINNIRIVITAQSQYLYTVAQQIADTGSAGENSVLASIEQWGDIGYSEINEATLFVEVLRV